MGNSRHGAFQLRDLGPLSPVLQKKMANNTPKLDDPARSEYEDRQEAMCTVSSRKDDLTEIRASLYQPAIVTSLPFALSTSSQKDVVDFSFGRKDLMSTTPPELSSLSKDDRLVLETFRALTAGNIGSVSNNFWSSRAPTGLEPSLPPFSSSKGPLDCYSSAISLPQKDLLPPSETYSGIITGLPTEHYQRGSKPDERLYAPPPLPSQPIDTYPNLLSSSHRSQDSVSDMYRNLLSGYRLATYPGTYDTGQGINMKSMELPVKVDDLERSTFEAARDREQSNADFETIHAARQVYTVGSDVSDLQSDKSDRYLESSMKTDGINTVSPVRYTGLSGKDSELASAPMQQDLNTDRLRELAETVAYSQAMETQPNYIETMQKFDGSPFGASSNDEVHDNPEMTCLCITDLAHHARNNHKKYTCGGCSSKFVTVCQLHDHLKCHGSGGSYHFDHMTNIAFPKFDSVCNFVQTEDIIERSDEAGEEVTADSQDVSETSFCDNEPAEVNEPTNNDIADHDDDNTLHCNNNCEFDETVIVKCEDTVVPTDEDTVTDTFEHQELSNRRCSARKGRKRKQENPKQTKARKVETMNTKPLIKPIKKRKSVRKLLIIEELADTETTEVEGKSDDKELIDRETFLPKRKCRKTTNYSDTSDSQNEGRKTGTRLCSVCHTFIEKGKMKLHMQTHEGPSICEICGKTFSKPRFLKKHMIVHCEVKPWKCELCGQQFCQKAEYTLHMNGHEGR